MNKETIETTNLLRGTEAVLEARSLRLQSLDADPEVDAATLAAANARHDAEHGHPLEWERGWRKRRRK